MEIDDMPKLVRDIDLLMEKFLHGFNKYGKTVEVYENPTKKEQKDARTAEGTYTKRLRFIADGEKKRIWIWNAGLVIHDECWSEIKKVVHDNRQLYKDWDLVSGEIEEDGSLDVHYVVSWGKKEVIEQILDLEWDWVDKYFKGFAAKFDEGVRKEMRAKGWD